MIACRFVDGAERLCSARCFIGILYFGVLMATAPCNLLLKMTPIDAAFSDNMKPQGWLEREFHGIPVDPLSIALLVGVHVFGSLS